jgi:hypothetical protein
MAWTQQDTSFKKLQNKRITTSTGKGIDEEKGASSLELYLPDIKTELIPGTPPGSSTSVLTYTGAIGQTLVVDTSVPGNLTWFATTGYGNTTDANNGTLLSESQRLGDWLSDKYDGFGTVSGAGYEIKVYDVNSNLITKADPSDWLFDYQTGILVFNSTSTTYGLVSSTGPFRVVGYRYTGKKGIIPAYYGGLGYTTYNLGDLFVGAGSTIIKFPLGSNNQVLKIDTTSSTGLTWGTAASSAISTINGLTDSTQIFATGTSGNFFNISSIGASHTFNIPIAGTGSTGLVTTLAQSFAGIKTFTNDTIISSSTVSTSTSTGALTVTGGVGIGGSLHVTSTLPSNISGIVLSNGVVTLGAWAGTLITALYGGTGYDSYTKGDILVGAGNTFIKLNVGTDNYVLTASSNSASGLTWSPTAATGITTLNGLTATNQTFEIGYTGAFPAFSSNTSTHTLNIPLASSGSTGLISTQAQTIAGAKTFSSNVIVSDATDSSAFNSGALVVTGGVGIGGSVNIQGNLTVNGTFTTINSTTVTVADKNIELGVVSVPTDVTAQAGGITLKGATDKSIIWYSGVGWSSSESWNIASGNTFKIGNTSVLSSTSLGTGVTNSSLTALGTISTGVWAGTLITALYGGTGYDTYTKGDILVGAGNTFIKLNVGTNNYVLTANSSSATGLTWSPTAAVGITTLNGINVGTQTLETGTSGAFFNISSVGSSHTFNIPIAGSGSTGLITTLAQTIAGQKTFTSAIIGDLTGTATTAGFAITANYASQSGYAITSGFASTSSYSYESGYGITSGFATTASYAYQSGYGITSGLATTANYASQSGFAITSGFATTSANVNVYSTSSGIFYPLLSSTTSSAFGISASVNNLFSFDAATGAFGATSINIFSGQSYSIGGNSVLSGTSLGTGVTNSSLTALGTINTGVWAGTLITALYGGTGYNSYTKGDILVGFGSTFIKLNVGADNFVLTADTTTPSGVKWTSVAGLSITSINGLTSSAQFFSTGSSGTGFNISSSGNTHAFNIPIAGTGATGLVSTLAQSFAGVKTFTNDVIVSSTTGSTAFNTGALTVYGGLGVSGQLSFNQAALGYTGATDPSMAFIGSTNVAPITLTVLSDNSLLWEGSSGKLFGINNNLSSGWIFNVGDISGLPIIRANADGTIAMAEFAANVGIGLSNPSYKLHVAGDTNLSSSYVYRINGSSVLSASSLGTGVTNSSLTAVGTISTGVWAGTLITALYGGSGYSSYTKGDILVGAGNTFIKLNVGTDNFVLTASASSATGLTWSPTAAVGITTLNGINVGTQTLATGTSGAFFNISSVGSSHTFNIPIAGSGATGLITTQAQTIAGQKTFTSAIIGDLTGTATTAGFALTSNYANQSGYAITSGIATTAILALTVASNSTSVASNYNVPFFSGSALSTNNNLYYNPSTGLNSNLYTGTWAGNTITSFYGGTGFQTYSTGDLLVGAGSTLTKISVGTNNFVLVADNTVAGGIKWANASGLAITNINGLTASKQDLAFGYSGSVPAFSSSGFTHTLNIPLAGTGSTGLVSTQAQSFAGIKTFTNAVTITDNTGSGSYTSGALVVTGGVGIGGTLNVQGDFNVQGTFTTINSTIVTVADKNIELGSVATPSDLTAEGGGITLRGATNKSINWYSGVGWSSSESFSLASGNTYKIAGTNVLSATSLGTGVTNSSLTALGTITTGTWSATAITALYGGTGLDPSFTVGDILYANTANTWGRLTANSNSGYLLASAGSGATPTYLNPATLSVGFASTASYAYQSGYGITSGLATTATYASQSGYAITSGSSNTSGFATTAGYAYQSGYGITSGFATTAGYSHQAGYAITSGSSNTSGFATTAANLNISNAASGIFHPVLSNTASSTSGIGASVNGFFSFNAASGAFGATSVNILSGQSYSVGGNSVLSATSLGTGVTNSSLTALGTISTGVWAGSLITGLYGGTGYNSYTKGDILVGAGSTFIKLNVGANDYVLTANSSSATGLTWSPTAAVGITTLNGINVGTQTLATGTSGDFFNISSVGSSHTFNIPIAGTGATGLVTTLAQTFTGAKTFDTTLTVSATTPSTSYSSGALIVAGGAGFAGTIYTQTDLNVGSSTKGRLFFSQATLGSAGTTIIPSMAFIGATNSPITLSVLADNSLSFDGSSGQLFSINNNLSSGWIFAVNDISGLPLLRANADGTIAMGEFAGNIGLGLSNPSYKLHVVGDTNLSSTYVYRINGTSVLSSSSLGTGVTNSSLTALGTVSTGTWAATAITSFYGGTGFQTYSTGDLLVGAGSTLIKLPVGTNNFVLTADSAVAGGVKWTSTAASGITAINGLSDVVQYFATGNSGTFFNISSSGSTHTFNIPIAGTGATGLVTTLAQSFSGVKTFTNDTVISSSTVSTSTSTGALTVTGGVGIGGSLYTGTSTADSISGVVLNNGVITSGAWAGTLITALYGGTGYNSYTLGDFLVGAGNTFIKLPVGINSYVLGADSSKPSGVGWTTVTPLTVSDTPPASPKNADLWFNSIDGGLLVYYSDVDTNQWVEIALGSGIDLSQPVHITNTTASTSNTSGALIVDGGVGVAGAVYATSFNINGVYDQISSTLVTSNTNANQVALSISATSFRTAKIVVQITSGSNYHSQEILMVHDDSQVYMTEYAIVNTGAIGSTFDGDISGGNMRFLVTPTNAVTTYKIACSAMRI